MEVKRLIAFLLMCISLFFVVPVYAEGELCIDSYVVYPGMNESYLNGYTPVVYGDEVRIVLPLKGGLGSTLSVIPAFGNTTSSPLTIGNYNLIVHRDSNGIFVIDITLKVLDEKISGVFPVTFDVQTSQGTTGFFTVYVTLKGKHYWYDWLEEHSTFIGICINALCWLIGIVSAGLLFYYNSYKKKKAAALFGFYVHYDALLSILEKQLKLCKNNKNPYVLLYADDAQINLKLLYPEGTAEKTIAEYSPISKQLKELLLKSENNAFPRLKKKTEWYNNNLIVIDFALMITDGINLGSIEYDKEQLDKECKDKWNALNAAIKSLREEIKLVQF